MKLSFIALTVVGAMSVLSANANLYVQGNVGRSGLDANKDPVMTIARDVDVLEVIKKDKAPNFRVAVGNDTGTFRYAGDFTYFGSVGTELKHEFGKDSTDLHIASVGGSIIADIAKNDSVPVVPYVGARVGINRFQGEDVMVGSAETVTKKVNKTTFGAGLVAGVQYHINSAFAVDAGVEYNRLGQIDVKDDRGNKLGEIKPVQKGFNVGVKYHF